MKKIKIMRKVVKYVVGMLIVVVFILGTVAPIFNTAAELNEASSIGYSSENGW